MEALKEMWEGLRNQDLEGIIDELESQTSKIERLGLMSSYS
jgi:hypothetical protein